MGVKNLYHIEFYILSHSQDYSKTFCTFVPQQHKIMITTIIKNEAEKLLATNWKVRGRIYNLKNRGWTFEFNNTTTSLGLANFWERRIKVSRVLANQNPDQLDEWMDTLRHEVAHALDYEVFGGWGHGKTWKHCCSITGARPKASCDGKIRHKSRWTLTCPSCGTTVQRDRVRKDLSCGSCCRTHNNGQWSEKFIMVKTRN